MESNAEWLLFQLGRDVQLSKLCSTNIKSKYKMNWVLPGELKNDLYNTPTYTEADLYGIVMSAFLKFLVENEKDLSHKKSWRVSETIDFVESIIHTKIKVEDNEVMIYTKSPELIDVIKEAIKNERYTLRTISSKTEAKSWWEPTMKEK